jgi:hypothetical protein
MFMKQKDALSVETTTCVKGIFALIVVLAHLKNYTTLFPWEYSAFK